MSTAVSNNRLEPAQHTAAKVAGFLYLFTIITANFAEFYAHGRLIVSGDAVQTARNIAASERLFRLGTVSNLITFASVVILLLVLYVVLKPINKNVALLAAFWRLAECAIFSLITLNDFVALRLLSGADYLRAFTRQLQALAYVCWRSRRGISHRTGVLRTGVDRVRLPVIQVALHPSSAGRLGNLLVVGGGKSSLWPSWCSPVWRTSWYQSTLRRFLSSKSV